MYYSPPHVNKKKRRLVLPGATENPLCPFSANEMKQSKQKAKGKRHVERYGLWSSATSSWVVVGGWMVTVVRTESLCRLQWDFQLGFFLCSRHKHDTWLCLFSHFHFEHHSSRQKRVSTLHFWKHRGLLLSSACFAAASCICFLFLPCQPWSLASHQPIPSMSLFGMHRHFPRKLWNES